MYSIEFYCLNSVAIGLPYVTVGTFNTEHLKLFIFVDLSFLKVMTVYTVMKGSV